MGMRNSEVTGRRVRGVRRASMSVLDGFIYNFLAMGVIFPWVYMWGSAAFPGASISLAILLAFAAQVPISIAYSVLASAIPVNGGDYVYQKEAFGRAGAIAVLSGFVVWILQWVALSGWLFATLGLAPLFMSFAAATDSKKLTLAAILIESPGGVLLVSCALSIGAVLLLKRGLRVFAQVQRILFVLTILAVCTMMVLFARPQAEIFAHLNHFVSSIASHLALRYPKGMTLDFPGFLETNIRGYGYLVDPKFSILAT